MVNTILQPPLLNCFGRNWEQCLYPQLWRYGCHRWDAVAYHPDGGCPDGTGCPGIERPDAQPRKDLLGLQGADHAESGPQCALVPDIKGRLMKIKKYVDDIMKNV